MKEAWRPRPPTRRERIVAGMVAAATGVAAGLATLYLARIAMGRDELRLDPPGPHRKGPGG